MLARLLCHIKNDKAFCTFHCLTRMVLQEGGYEQWEWQGNKVNYVVAGDVNSDATPVLLIHGFGASVYHWRYNIPALAASGRPVYAIDLIGFGWSDRALIQYSAAMWADQVSSFIRDVIGRPAVLVGNSVGGYVTLTTAANHPDVVAGTVLVNAAGKFSEAPPGTAPLSGADESPRELKARKAAAAMPVETHGHQHGAEEQVPFSVVVREKVGELVEGVVAAVGKVARRVVLHVTFLQAKQPGRIKQVLELVYPNAASVDEELVRSIVLPTRDPNAAEVYYRLSTQVLLHPSALSLNDLLSSLRAASESPMLLLWGALDPWMTPAKAQTIVDNYSAAQRVDISAGHCPHDEDPDAFNQALLQWLQQSKF
ncbi:unnamed protein product [Closterium sp. Yama58-4]|nr:unnamed protein product [Closterium sp. Yama58-4]